MLDRDWYLLYYQSVIRNLTGIQNTKGVSTNEQYNEYSERRQGLAYNTHIRLKYNKIK